ncbi:kinase-like protein, partial [Aaosphaeria arxii CBS 175.79]
ASTLHLHSNLHHPNIVTFHRAVSFEDNTCIAQEQFHNGSLVDSLKSRKSCTMPEIRRFFFQLCSAAKYLHHPNIVHCDLKTGNILFHRGMSVKTVSFGLAAVLVSAKDVRIRKTSTCGMSNYLSLDILDKQGYNDKPGL